jgi:hypothetical protein
LIFNKLLVWWRMANEPKFKTHYYNDGNVLIRATCEVEAREKALNLRREFEAAEYDAESFLIEDDDDLAELREREREWPDYVYVMRCEPGPVKIGVAASVTSRARLIQTGNPYPVTIVAAFMCSQSIRVERTAHKLLADSRLCGEWFNVDVERAVRAVQEAARKNYCLVLPVWEPVTALALQCGRQRDSLRQTFS